MNTESPWVRKGNHQVCLFANRLQYCIQLHGLHRIDRVVRIYHGSAAALADNGSHHADDIKHPELIRQVFSGLLEHHVKRCAGSFRHFFRSVSLLLCHQSRRLANSWLGCGLQVVIDGRVQHLLQITGIFTDQGTIFQGDKTSRRICRRVAQ